MGVSVAVPRAAGPPAPGPAAGPRRTAREDGVLSLEAVMILPVLALLVVGLLEVAGLVRDVLLVHEAARMGVRVAATTTGSEPVRRAARDAAPELDLQVSVDPLARRDGDLVTVRVTTARRIGPVQHRVQARALARVEPVVGANPPTTASRDGPP
jgi:Flp pilus assembly protein TadG